MDLGRYFPLSNVVRRKPNEGPRMEPEDLEMKQNIKAIGTLTRMDRAMLGRGCETVVSHDLESQAGMNTLGISATAYLEQKTSKVEDNVDLVKWKLPSTQNSLSKGYRSSEATVLGSFSTTQAHSEKVAPSHPTVSATEDPRHSLDVDLRPNFEEHRSVWGRVLGTISEGRRSRRMKDSLGTGSSRSRP